MSGMTNEENVDLDALARRAAAGDQGALNQLLATIQPRVMRLCGRILPVRQDAEEASQDVLMKVATKISGYEGRSKFTTWLHVVASNTARQTYRSLKRRAAERPVEDMPTAADPRTTSVIAGSRLDLLEALETLERNQPDLVEALVMRDIGEIDYAEIADALSIPVGTAKSRIHRARQAMRPLLLVQD